MPAFLHSDAIEKLPSVTSPEVLGLHHNAEISYSTRAAISMWRDLLKLQPQTGEQTFANELPSFGAVFLRLLCTKGFILVNLRACVRACEIFLNIRVFSS